ncbi:ABC transporter substrate-binding protein [Halorubrum vacuolatum]|uniref:Branched-chain amino acid transport system substrate-binding protein n=1 Tax=Halorubrum vacuolatum TaxID=63740 RepID=A0A238UQ39_HALVU|nr:ABC transporter substrate-binding protein [Halorubrum vacuolatum]SNR24240.1 branched-chain amino acid transport system substrate-binding protein [Halorubrum vacuolatum]
MTHERRPASRRTFLRSGGVAAAAAAVGPAALAGCLGDDGDDDVLTIGALQPLSGDFAAWGQAHEAGLAFAVEEINEDGGVLGRDLVVETADTGSDAGEADTDFRRFVERDDAVAITGPVSSDVGLRTRETAEELSVPVVLHMAGSHTILPKDTRYTFRVGSQPAVSDVLPQIELIEERGYDTVGAIIGDYEWGTTLEASLESLIPDDVTLEIATAPVGEDDFTPFLRDLPEDLDLLVATGHPPGSIAIHNQALEIGLDPELTTGAGLPPDVLASGLGENATEGFLHLHVSDPFGEAFADVAERFVAAEEARFDTHEAYGYLTGQLIAAAIEEADEADPAEIAAAIRGIEFDTLLAEPIRYTEWGELDGFRHMLSAFEADAPDYYPDGEWRLEETVRSSPLDGFDPDEYDFIEN